MRCGWSTKNREYFLNPNLLQRLALSSWHCEAEPDKALAVGGTTDHVHVLVSLPATPSIAKAVQLLKGKSSKWIHEAFPKMRSFAWQEGTEHLALRFLGYRQPSHTSATKPSTTGRDHFTRSLWECFARTDLIMTSRCWIKLFFRPSQDSRKDLILTPSVETLGYFP
jgi:hypothetical protein